MRTVRAIAFARQFQACGNSFFELRSGLRRERCGGACRGEIVGLSSKLKTQNGKASRKVHQWLYYIRLGSGSVSGEMRYAHAPALQEFGDKLTRRIRHRTQSRDGKRIRVCPSIALVACARACVCVFPRICARLLSIHGLPTRARSQLAGNSLTRPCDGDVNGLL